jgi:LAS superfamily LD-carboxypeptidase LdcB
MYEAPMGICPTDANLSAQSLNSLEVTGRVATHVRDAADLKCVLHPGTAEGLLALKNEALAAGIELEIVSGFRNFNRQLAIWNAKFNGQRPVLDATGAAVNHAELYESELIDAILIWSALPGASRHHWGSDIDVIDTAALPEGARPQLVPAEFAPGGCFERLGGWLESNMSRFGFYRPYSTWRGGVQPEPWHLSYAPVASGALGVLSLEVLREAITRSDMLGRQTVLDRLPELYEKYVLAVDPPG